MLLSVNVPILTVIIIDQHCEHYTQIKKTFKNQKYKSISKTYFKMSKTHFKIVKTQIKDKGGLCFGF